MSRTSDNRAFAQGLRHILPFSVRQVLNFSFQPRRKHILFGQIDVIEMSTHSCVGGECHNTPGADLSLLPGLCFNSVRG